MKGASYLTSLGTNAADLSELMTADSAMREAAVPVGSGQASCRGGQAAAMLPSTVREGTAGTFQPPVGPLLELDEDGVGVVSEGTLLAGAFSEDGGSLGQSGGASLQAERIVPFNCTVHMKG